MGGWVTSNDYFTEGVGGWCIICLPSSLHNVKLISYLRPKYIISIPALNLTDLKPHPF